MQRLWPWLAAILSGVLGAASLPPFDQTWLCWLALTPLIAAILFPGEKARRRWLRSGHNLFLAVCLATAWTGLEWIRGWLFSGFGWNGLGIALHATWPMIQTAEFTGVAGVTFFVAFSNAILATTARRIWQETRT